MTLCWKINVCRPSPCAPTHLKNKHGRLSSEQTVPNKTNCNSLEATEMDGQWGGGETQ